MPVTSWGLAVTGVCVAECGTYWPPTIPPLLAHCCGLYPVFLMAAPGDGVTTGEGA